MYPDKRIAWVLGLATWFLGSWLLFRSNFTHITYLTTFFRLEDKTFLMPVFKERPLVIWTIDFHATPAYDLRCYLEPMGVQFIYRNYDNFKPRCGYKKNCNNAKPLKILNVATAINLDYQLIPKFYTAYKDDKEMKTVDAFVCFHAVSLCELYEPFNKSMIIIATIRYELGRHGKERWARWNQNLIKYASQPWNFIGANNMYDSEYIKYFTGHQPLLLPSWGNYTNQTYNASRPGFLVVPSHNQAFLAKFWTNYTMTYKAVNCTFPMWNLRQKYPVYEYSDMAAHQGLVYVPYQVSTMSFFEQYRMNIPIFAPSQELLIQWELKHDLLAWRHHDSYLRVQSNRSAIDPHPTQRSIPDPNSYTEESIRYWLKFCDYYHFPHITYYETIEHLVRILQTITKEQLMGISSQMKLFNEREDKRLKNIWRNILLKVASYSNNRPH